MSYVRTGAVFAITLVDLFAAGCTKQLPTALNPATSAAGPSEKSRTDTNSKGARTLYVANTTPSITEYPADSNGNVAPTRTIAGSKTHMGLALVGIAVDSKGVIYVSREDGGILEFAPGADGNVAPIRRITAATNGPIDASQLAIDSSDNLYAANGDDIKVFAPGANGVAKPLADISGPATTFNEVTGVAVDAAGDVFAANFNGASVLEFAPGADGNVAPIATISGPATTIADPSHVGLSRDGDIYVTDESVVQVFAPGSNGNVPPARTITFSGSNGPYSNVGVAGNSAYLGLFNGGTAFSVAAYKAGLQGSSEARRTIAGDKTQIDEPVGVGVR